MQDGDPEVITPSEVELKETVLSQETNEPEVVNPPKEATPQEKFKNSQFAQTRIANREWKKHLNDLRNDPSALLEKTAREQGFDPEKEENKGHLKVMAGYEKEKAAAEFKIKNNASNQNLSETFEAMGIKPDSTKGIMIGTALFKKYGVDNPDVYTEELVRKELDAISEEFQPKKDPINETILRKASSNLPQKQNPKGAAPASNEKEVEDGAKRLGVSKEKYKILIEKKKQKPSWA